MLNLLLGIGVILILVVLYLLFRLGGAVSVVKKTDEKRETPANTINGALLMVFFIVGTILFIWFDQEAEEHLLPVASEHGVWTDELFWITMMVITAVFMITNFLLFWFAFRYRYKENRTAKYYPENNRLEIIWTIVPAIVLTLLVFAGFRTWSDIMFKEVPEDAVIVEIKGKQFAWEVRYPGKDGQLGAYDYRLIDATNQFGVDFTDEASMDDFMPRKIYLPKGRAVLFKIRAVDVLHSVFAPHFRLKMDAVPGMPTRFLFTPTKTTAEMKAETGNQDFQYEIACTEICGRGHFAMKMLVEVVEEEEYQTWFAEQKPWAEANLDYVREAIQKRGTNQALLNRVNELKSSF